MTNLNPDDLKVEIQARQQNMLIRAKEALFTQGDWLEATDQRFIDVLDTTEPTTLLFEWRNAGQIFSIIEDGVEYFPFYALNPENDYQPYPVIEKVIDIFGGRKRSKLI